MMRHRARALDLFCGAGGASMGLYQAGFEVVGVDIKRQARYPFTFFEADALTFPLDGFDFIWASPPCQAFTCANNRDRLGRHPNLIELVRRGLAESGALSCIENVPGAPIRADVVLDGTMFPDLRVVRRRHFEVNFPAPLALGFPTKNLVGRHGWASCTDGDNSTHIRAARRRAGLPVHDTMAYRRAAMGITWPMNRMELGNAIPPAYSCFIGQAVLRHLDRRAAVR